MSTENAPATGEPVCYTLVEFDEDTLEESPVYGESGETLVLGPTPDGGSAFDNAVGMALFILGADHDGPEREVRVGVLPFVGLLGHDHPNPDEDERGDDPQSWAVAWVGLDGVVHHGDYEAEASLWTRRWVANVIGEELIPEDLPVAARLVPVGDDGVHVLYGDRRSGVTVLVEARDCEEVERRVIATFGDHVTVDDCGLSVDQTPIAAQLAALGTEAR